MAKRRRSTGFEAWFNAAQTPMYLLDKRRQVTIFNRGCEELTGWLAEDIVGELCDYTSPDDKSELDQLLSSLCPPPDVFEGQILQCASFIPQKDGGNTPRLLHHYPMLNRDGVIDRVLTFVMPLETPSVAQAASPAQKLHAELASLKTRLRERYGFSSIIAVSHGMRRVLEQIQLGTASQASIHFVGENGTGREHFARAVHNESDLATRAFVPLDCKRLSVSEVLATVRRLFDKQPNSGAILPHLLPGTLFFRSVEHLERDIQQLIVDEWNPTESELPQRLMTSSLQPLDALIEDEEILPEFLQLCGTLEVKAPALRERSADLALLAQLFVEQRNAGVQRQIEGLADETMTKFRKYHWPSNLSELRNVIDSAVDACQGTSIVPDDLPMQFRSGMDARRASPTTKLTRTELEPILQEVEREHIQKILEATNGNRAEAARLLGLTRPKLYRRLEQLGLG